MKATGYLGTGIASGVLGVLVLAMANSDDDLQTAIANADIAMGNTPQPESDLIWELIAVGLFVAAAILVLIGIIGLGVRAGQSRD